MSDSAIVAVETATNVLADVLGDYNVPTGTIIAEFLRLIEDPVYTEGS